ncbi:unnamed protein product [Rhizophagus irregularis]|nr:unnamed protein product [Rhizophagus irregularis]
MESKSSNNTPPLILETIEEKIFGLQHEEGSETCSLCNEPDLLFKPNGANLEPVVRLSCLHSFHLRCIIISLEKNMTYSRCQRLIYLGEDDDVRLNPQEEDRVKKFFKELSNKP